MRARRGVQPYVRYCTRASLGVGIAFLGSFGTLPAADSALRFGLCLFRFNWVTAEIPGLIRIRPGNGTGGLLLIGVGVPLPPRTVPAGADTLVSAFMPVCGLGLF